MSATLKGTPRQGLVGATLGFFVGFAAVALFGPMAHKLQTSMGLSPAGLGLTVAAPLLSGSLLRIPFAAWVDATGGRKPFLLLLSLSAFGLAGLLFLFRSAASGNPSASCYPLLLILGVLCGCGIATFSVGIGQVSYWFPQSEQGWALGAYAGIGNVAPGIFSFLLPLAFAKWGFSGAYWAWLVFLCAGALAYALISRDAWYFQLRKTRVRDTEAQLLARERGQEIFPRGGAWSGLLLAAKRWRTWALVALYFTTFGGFLALTAWFPAFWSSYYKLAPAGSGTLTALFSITASLTRVAGGCCADRISGERTARLALAMVLTGSLLMSFSSSLPASVIAALLIAVGMGFNNAAVFKMAPQYVCKAVGGASGLIGGLGAFGGFVLPPAMGLIAESRGLTGYASGFMLLTLLAALCLPLASALAANAPASATAEQEGYDRLPRPGDASLGNGRNW